MKTDLFLPDTEATLEAGRQLGATLEAGQVVALTGELGAGKTHFSQGVAEALGVPAGEVTSPTFTLVNQYAGKDLTLYHLDFYRLESESELDGIGWDDLCESGGVVLAEWANLFPEVFPPSTISVRLSHSSGGRCLEIFRP